MNHAGKGIRVYGGRQKGRKTHGKGEATVGAKHTVMGMKHMVTGMVLGRHGNGIKGS